LANQLGIEMPISEAVEAVLHRDASVEAMIDGLLRRPHRSE
jgi:glycerol-3-phosphate dehydrogenase